MADFPVPPGPKGFLPGGQLLLFRRTPDNFLQLARDYGDVVHFQVGPQRFYLFNEPDHIREVLVTREECFEKGWGPQRGHSLMGEGLVTSEGTHHRRQRRLMQPAFHRARFEACAATVVRLGAEFVEKLPEGQAIDIWREIMRLTLTITNESLFDTDVTREVDEVIAATATVFDRFNRWMFPYAGLLRKFFALGKGRYEEALQRLDNVIYCLIAERRESNEDHDDLLSILMAARDEEGDRGGMSERELRDEVATLFIASHETIASALAWTSFLISQHAEVEARLHEELDRELAGRSPTAGDYSRLAFTQQVFTEAMRLYPPVWMLGRRAIKECEVGGYTLPRGSIALVSPYVTHRDARHYPDPERFDPERWRPEARAALPQFAYFPFGGGARRCIGEGFAWMEGVLLLATLASRWRMRLAAGADVQMQPLFVLRPKSGVSVILKRRRRWS